MIAPRTNGATIELRLLRRFRAGGALLQGHGQVRCASRNPDTRVCKFPGASASKVGMTCINSVALTFADFCCFWHFVLDHKIARSYVEFTPEENVVADVEEQPDQHKGMKRSPDLVLLRHSWSNSVLPNGVANRVNWPALDLAAEAALATEQGRER